MGKSVTVATTAPAADPVALATPLATLSALKVDKSMPCSVRGMTTSATTGDGGGSGGGGKREAGLGLGDGDGLVMEEMGIGGLPVLGEGWATEVGVGNGGSGGGGDGGSGGVIAGRSGDGDDGGSGGGGDGGSGGGGIGGVGCGQPFPVYRFATSSGENTDPMASWKSRMEPAR